jgi:hypothetical protein
MSAIGSYVRMRTPHLDRCIELADKVSPDQRKWPWQSKSDSNREAFLRAWAAAALEEVDLDGSGYLLASYFLAQSELNQVTDPFDLPDGLALAKVFTGAFTVRTREPFPALDAGALKEFCVSEWGEEESPQRQDGIVRVHAFIESGLSRIGDGEAGVFIIA